MAYVNSKSGKNNAAPISEWKLKELMCDIGRRIWIKGFCAGNEGNHSYRLSADRILCTPTMISKGNLKPDDLCVVDMEGKQVSGRRKRTSEMLLHLAIYKEREDVKAVIHSHPPHATAFAIAGVPLPSCIHPEAEIFLGPVRTASYVTPGDQRLPESIQPYIKESNTILLGNHGVVCYGPDLENAYYKLEIVDAYARVLLLAKQLGTVRPLDTEEMTDLLSLKNRIGMDDPRVKGGQVTPACTASDFLSRVGEVASKGRMATPAGGVCPVSGPTPLERTVAQLAPANYCETDLEQLVQVITDQIMAAAN